MSVYRNFCVMFCELLARFLKIIAPGVGFLHNFSAPWGGAFELSLSPGVEEFAFSRKSPGFALRRWPGLELNDTLLHRKQKQKLQVFSLLWLEY